MGDFNSVLILQKMVFDKIEFSRKVLKIRIKIHKNYNLNYRCKLV